MSIVKDTIAITAITLVAGLALGVVQDITEGPIAQQQEQSKLLLSPPALNTFHENGRYLP